VKEKKDDGLSRRDVGKILVGGVAVTYAGGLAYPVVRYLSSPPNVQEGGDVQSVTLETPKSYAPGSGQLFRFGRKPALLLRRPDGSFVALMATCKHLGCTVRYQQERDRIFCACHGGVYDPASGKNVGGPPPRPLDRLEVDASGEKVVVRRPGAGEPSGQPKASKG
jgi:cytochrome b6-f complex iron-sulfur subunit